MISWSRTRKALGDDLMDSLAKRRFCVVGCGGTGATFAEMLVRSGATKITLIDGGPVKRSDLNRVFTFSSDHCKQGDDQTTAKVDALRKRLLAIRVRH